MWASWANRTPSADVGHPDARNIRAATPGSCETPRAVGDRRARRNPPPEFRGRGLVAPRNLAEEDHLEGMMGGQRLASRPIAIKYADHLPCHAFKARFF